MPTLSYPRKFFIISVVSLFISGCASYGIIENQQINEVTSGKDVYSVDAFNHRLSGKDTVIILAFSGGGSRVGTFLWRIGRA